MPVVRAPQPGTGEARGGPQHPAYRVIEQFRADDLPGKVPRRAWRQRSAGAGAKGLRMDDRAVADLVPTVLVQRLGGIVQWSGWEVRHCLDAPAANWACRGAVPARNV